MCVDSDFLHYMQAINETYEYNVLYMYYTRQQYIK